MFRYSGLLHYCTASVFVFLLTSNLTAGYYAGALADKPLPGPEYGFWACAIIMIGSIIWATVGANLRYPKIAVSVGFLTVFAAGVTGIRWHTTVLDPEWTTWLCVTGIVVYFIGYFSVTPAERKHPKTTETA